MAEKTLYTCVVKIKGVIMVFGLGMNGSMSSAQQMNQAYGGMKQTGSVLQNLKNQYGCEDCFEHGPYFANYPIPVQQVPREVVRPNIISRIWSSIMGG